jgi:hypothetical protein
MIVWRNEWINPFETPWSIFEKLCYANNATRIEVLRTLGNSEVKKIKSYVIGDSRRELIQLSGFDPLLLQQYLEYDLVGHNKSAISNILKPVQYYIESVNTWFPLPLRWCEQCMRTGYHSWLHQFALVQHCPIHKIKLIDACPTCYNNIPFLLSDKSLGNPFTCRCGFKLADFTPNQWSRWKYPFQLSDNTVIEWLERAEEGWGNNNRLLFIPRAASILMFCEAQVITCKFQGKRYDDTHRHYSISDEFIHDVYDENKRCFRTIDRYIKNKILYKHRNCIRNLQELRKHEEGEFPPICPYAYAYVYWKHTLLMTDQFYNEVKGDILKPRKFLGLELVTKLIEPHITCFKYKLFKHTNLYEIDNRRLVHWTINRYSSELCLNYFYQWLKIARTGAEQVRVPTWTEVSRMIDNSQPQIIYKHHSDVGLYQEVEVIISHDLRNSDYMHEMKCATSTKQMRKEYRSMSCFTPMSVAMRAIDSTIENKQVRDYVNQYVSRLTI